MQLGRDLMDNQALDRFNRKAGKVDGIVMVLRNGRPPRVTAIEIGLPTVLARIHPRLGTLAARLERWLGIDAGRPVRIDIDRVERAGINVRIDVDANGTAAYAWEHWVCDAFICRIPGAGKRSGKARKK
jgi:hypothetical protein